MKTNINVGRKFTHRTEFDSVKSTELKEPRFFLLLSSAALTETMGHKVQRYHNIINHLGQSTSTTHCSKI